MRRVGSTRSWNSRCDSPLSMIAMNWQADVRYVPSWMEIVTSITIITAGVLTFRWIVNRMPILAPHPEYRNDRQ